MLVFDIDKENILFELIILKEKTESIFILLMILSKCDSPIELYSVNKKNVMASVTRCFN